jgi:DNA repair exonuclease SbcCD ATPase subunit
MKFAAISAVLFFLLLTSAGQEKSAPLVIHSRADMAQAVDQIQSDLSTLNQHHENYRQAAEKLSTLYANLSKKSEEVSKAAHALSSSPSNPGGASVGQASSNAVASLLAATQQMQETQMSFNLQYLQLQETMQNENRQYTMVSNIMKTKHDTVKNSIGNIR